MPFETSPFLRWPGGKRWLIPTVRQIVAPFPMARYIEPFLGGGAVFFGLSPSSALLSDVNSDLINTYEQVRRWPNLIAAKLSLIPVSEASYFFVRRWNPACPIDAAVRFLFLNRTAFSGLYRLNSNGQFNVPYGGGSRSPIPLWRDRLLVKAASALRTATITHCDFEDNMRLARPGDVIYCDPTYTVTHNNNGFIRYNERNFSWKDQIRLADAAASSARKGALVLVSNAKHDDIVRLYAAAHTIEVSRWSCLAPTPGHRCLITEMLFVFRPD